MNSKVIDRLSEDLASELAERKMWDTENIKSLISVRFKSALMDLLNEQISFEEKAYLSLLDKQSKNRVGSKEYVEIGYKLSIAKQKKATTNRLKNECKRDTALERLKSFVTKEYGTDRLSTLLETI